MKPMISISVVSHQQIAWVVMLLDDIRDCSREGLELILTLNCPEELPFTESDYPFPLQILRNSVPQGFAANHNRAFAHAQGQYFCVLNPDIRLKENPFSVLLACLQRPVVGVVAPLVVDANGMPEDNARRFPTPLTILSKAWGKCRGSDYAVEHKAVFPDWVGGMFMLFRREVFAKMKGFDERYFLYYEDVDLCARLKLQGYEIVLCPTSKVVHHAQRASHRSIKYLRWHLASMSRFFLSYPFLKICWLRLIRKMPCN